MSEKSLKQYAKEAKRRLKSGFWQSYKSEVEERKKQAVEDGIAVSKVVEYYNEEQRRRTISQERDDEDFYKKVKKLLDENGETDDIIGRLTDKKYFSELNYEQRQRYSMELSSKYLAALDRYKKEKSIDLIKSAK